MLPRVTEAVSTFIKNVNIEQAESFLYRGKYHSSMNKAQRNVEWSIEFVLSILKHIN